MKPMAKKSPKTKKTISAEKRLAALRASIDRLDARLLALLNQRSRMALAIGKIKHRAGGALYVPSREQAVLAQLRKRNRGPLSNASLEAIYREIMSAALSLEGALRIGVAGAARGELLLAARNHFGRSARYEEAGAPGSAIKRMLAGRWNALCMAESDLPAACAALQSGRLTVCGRPARGSVLLTRGES